jgi:hypothetical protein
MRNSSHKSLVATFRDHLIAWRKQEGWSRETMVQVLVEAHERIDGPAATGLTFEPATRDPFERQKVNADRVFRWLDDETKDRTILPTNFLPSILAALPMERRLHLLNDFLRPMGVSVTSIDQVADDSFDTALHLRAMLKESSEAHLALVNVPAEQPVEALEAARREVADVQESSTKAVRALDAAIAKARAVGGRLKNAVGMR